MPFPLSPVLHFLKVARDPPLSSPHPVLYRFVSILPNSQATFLLSRTFSLTIFLFFSFLFLQFFFIYLEVGPLSSLIPVYSPELCKISLIWVSQRFFQEKKCLEEFHTTMKVQLLLLLALAGPLCSFTRASKCTLYHSPAVSTLCPPVCLCLHVPCIHHSLSALTCADLTITMKTVAWDRSKKCFDKKLIKQVFILNSEILKYFFLMIFISKLL